MTKTNEMSLYQLTLTETQLVVVQQALDMYFRVGMGQINEVAEHLVPPEQDINVRCDRRDAAREFLRQAKLAAMPDLPVNAYYGIYSQQIDESNRIACDIHDVIRYCLAWQRQPEGGFGVAWDRPALKSGEPLPVLTCVEKQQGSDNLSPSHRKTQEKENA